MALDIDQISVIEFGVAGGNGLISLEWISEKVEHIYNIKIEVYGFDTGVGLPECTECYDLPNIFSRGRHPMDIDKLQKQLKRAKLILGNVENTIDEFVGTKPAPVAFCAIDLDLYSSTLQALRLLEPSQDILPPRIHYFFDDIMGLTAGDCVGERLAIANFNQFHEKRKISLIYGLKYFLPQPYCNQMWTEQYFIAHIFDHTLYNQFDGTAPLYNLSLADN